MIHHALSLLSIMIILSACATDNDKSERFSLIDQIEKNTNRPAQEQFSQTETSTLINQNSFTTDFKSEEKNRLVYYRGNKSNIPRVISTQHDFDVEELKLNFINAPAAQVAQAVIGDVLGKIVAVAEGVQGTITLTSPEAVDARTALDTLETVLAESNLALIENPSGFTLTSLDKARQGTQSINRGNQAIGFGSSIKEIKHTSPSNILKLAQPFMGSAVKLNAEDENGIIVLNGPKTDIQQASDIIDLFDVPVLTGRVSGLFEIKYADVTDLRNEIESVMADKVERNGIQLELIDLPRLNHLMVITRHKSTFDEIRGWIERLDIASGSDVRRLRYYVVQNAPAETIAGQLNAAFGSSSNSFISPASQNSSSQLTEDLQNRQVQRSTPQRLTNNNTNAVSIVPDELNNALIIRARDAEYREILSLIERMDILPQQVLIEATIAEVTLTDDLNFGIRWFWENGGSDVSFTPTENTGTSPIVPGFNVSYIDNIPSTSIALNTLASITDVSVLSAPSIMVQNNQTANLQVGDEVPILTQTSQGTAGDNAPIISTVQLRETGVILEVTPRINASGIVVMEISQEVSEAIPTVTAGIDSPTIQQRQFTSTVSVRDNATVALGGLIRESTTDNDSGIPYLKDAPFVGTLFGTTNKNTRRTELIIFLTPRIIKSTDDAEETIYYLKDRMQNLGAYLERG